MVGLGCGGTSPTDVPPTTEPSPTPPRTLSASPTPTPNPTDTLVAPPTALLDRSPTATMIPTVGAIPTATVSPTEPPTRTRTAPPTATPRSVATDTAVPPTAPPPTEPAPTPTATILPTPTLAPTPILGSDVRIDCILFDGQLSRAKPDEYVQITNHGAGPQELLDWVLHDKNQETQRFTFSTHVLSSGETIRVFTKGELVEGSENWGSFSFGRGSAIWNNSTADIAVLRDADGAAVSERSYDVDASPGCGD